MTPTNKHRRPGCYLIAVVIILLLLSLGVKGWRITQAVRSLQARQVQVETLLANGLTSLDPAAAESLVVGIRQDTITLRDETAVFMPLTPYLTWLPEIGPTLAVAPQLMTMADAGTEAAVHALRGFKPALALLQTNQPGLELLPDLLPIITHAEPELAAIGHSLSKITIARNQITNLDTLPWRIRSLIEQADKWLPVAEDGLKLAPHLPFILGNDSPRRYLIITQNSDELRPTGGFISGAIVVMVENGRLTDLTFLDANYLDAWSDDKRSLVKPYAPPPTPLQTFMQLELFLFRDANFWPDFPTSAEKMIELYRYGQDAPAPDGVIAVDPQFLQLLVQATGPIQIPNTETPIDSSNVIDALRAAWSIQDDEDVHDWILNRKDFIGVFAAAIQSKIELDFATVDLPVLTENMLQALETKHLQIYMRNPAVASVLNELHWDGRLPINPQGDFLMVVDTNAGHTKVNSLVTQSLNYQVHIQEDGTAHAKTTISYQHTGETTEQPCQQNIAYNRETAVDYNTLVNRCYWTYLRLYTPSDSQLTDSSRHIVAGETVLSDHSWDNTAQTVNDLEGLTTFANYMLLPQGQSLSSYFAYQLPSSIIQTHNGQSQYQLSLFKQAGANAQAVKVSITLPKEAQLAETSPAPTKIEENTIHFEFDLKKDTIVTIIYH